MIDQDRDGIIGADDLAAIYQQVGQCPFMATVDIICIEL
jgi:Ca2+-binding EF-hand superfamily protein